MYKIGITGSIGSGKTTIASMFASFSIPIFDADKEIKKILRKRKIQLELRNIWPSVIKKNYIDTLKLRKIIFSNNKEKKKLEKLLYPYLEIERKKFENSYYREKILVYDVPLIYETKSEKRYDKILLAYCDMTVQKKRVLTRDNISDSLFKNILKTQLSFDEKMKFKPYVINTNNIRIFIFIRVIILLIKILIKLRLENGK
tara:strand:- start:143 stop:745 length:603 start_codon:yes stop_codon:yes gene_type:complete